MQRKCSEANEEGWHEVQSGRVRSLPNQGDGDCLFRAISHQLGGALLAPQLRQHAVDYMENHLEDFTPQLLALGDDMADSGEIPAEQLQNPALPQLVLNILRLPWTWGGAECTAALARFLGRPIHIYLEHDATIEFHPIQQEEGAAAIRILHRFGNNGRRSHYESVLLWEPARAEQPQQAPAVEESSDAVQDDQAPENEVRPLGMELRSRPRCEPALNFRAEIFSDAEECQDVSQRIRKYRACRMCGIRVGRYGLMYCGAYPVCGTCIQEQFVNNSNLCNHCGNPVHGWMKVFNQN